MRINGYWLGASLITFTGLVFDTIRYYLMYPKLGMDFFPSIIEIILTIVFMGLAFPKDKRTNRRLPK